MTNNYRKSANAGPKTREIVAICESDHRKPGVIDGTVNYLG